MASLALGHLPFYHSSRVFSLLHPNALSVFAPGTVSRTQAFVPGTDRLSMLATPRPKAASDSTKVRHVSPVAALGAKRWGLCRRCAAEANSARARAGPGDTAQNGLAEQPRSRVAFQV